MDLLQFSGGLQTTTSSFLRSPDQLIFSMNVHGDTVGSLTKRLGYGEYGSSSASTDIDGLYSYNYVGGGTQYLFRYTNSVLSYTSGSGWSTCEGGLTADALPEFRVFLDELFMVGATSANSFLSTANVAGTTYTTTNNVTSAPAGKYIEVFRDRVYIANAEVSSTRYPDRLYFSSVPDSAGTGITWTSTDYERIYTNNGEEINGLHTNKTLNEILIFKANSLHTYDTYRVRDVGTQGTTSHRSVQTVNGLTYFFNANGIYAYDGRLPVLISRPIEKWIQGIDQTALADVFAASDDDKYYKLYVGSITVDGNTYTNCEIRYSTVDNSFTIYSYYDTFKSYATHKVSGITRVYAGTDDGIVHQLAKRDDAVYADDGNDIPAEFTFETVLGVPAERKFIDKALIYCTNFQNLTGRIRVKGRDWSTHFEVNDSEHEVGISPEDGRILQWNFSESSQVNPFIFEGVSFSPHLTTEKY